MSPRFPIFTLLGALAVATACAGSAPSTQRAAPAASTAAANRGTLFIVGGGAQPPALVARFVSLAGGPRARIAILPMASSEPEASGRAKAEELRGLGAEAFVVNVSGAAAESDSVVRLLRGATGIWFSGGDQSRLTTAVAGTAALRTIHDRYRAGAVVGGTSAGAAVMSDSMLTGNQVRAGEDTSGYFGDEFPRITRRSIDVVAGFGFLPGAIVDQHFLRRERHNRLISVVLERPTMLGVGIDEGTALLVEPDGRWTIAGASAAIVYDARAAEITPPSAKLLGASSMRVHLLPAGSSFDPRTGEVRLPRG